MILLTYFNILLGFDVITVFFLYFRNLKLNKEVKRNFYVKHLDKKTAKCLRSGHEKKSVKARSW